MCLIHRFTIYCTNMLQYMCFGPFYTLRPLKYKKKKKFQAKWFSVVVEVTSFEGNPL